MTAFIAGLTPDLHADPAWRGLSQGAQLLFLKLSQAIPEDGTPRGFWLREPDLLSLYDGSPDPPSSMQIAAWLDELERAGFIQLTRWDHHDGLTRCTFLRGNVVTVDSGCHDCVLGTVEYCAAHRTN